MSATEYLILVDHEDREVGQAEKLFVHQQNLLHRAFSIFVFHDQELLLQQRSLDKYHSPGLWTNTCCSHPRPNETIIDAGNRRLKEELGIETALTNVGYFYYQAQFANGLSEHENDHVLIGKLDNKIELTPNQAEIKQLRWISIPKLKQELMTHAEQFTPWFSEALNLALKNI